MGIYLMPFVAKELLPCGGDWALSSKIIWNTDDETVTQEMSGIGRGDGEGGRTLHRTRVFLFFCKKKMIYMVKNIIMFIFCRTDSIPCLTPRRYESLPNSESEIIGEICGGSWENILIVAQRAGLGKKPAVLRGTGHPIVTMRASSLGQR